MKQHNSPERATMLAGRRQRQISRQRGFTAIPNKRINQAMQERFAALLIEDATMRAETGIGGEPNIAELQQDAVRDVAKTLPLGRMVKSHHRRPSRSDDPAYRGIGGAGPVRQKALWL